MSEPSEPESKPLSNPRPLAGKESLSRRLVFSFVRVGLMLLVLLLFMQRSLIYSPTKTKRLIAKEAGFRQPIFDVSIKTHDQLTLHGWLAFSTGLTADPPKDVLQGITGNRPLVIVFHGNGGCRINRSHLILAFGSLDADLLIFDYRGYGDNPGKPSEVELIKDAHSVWNYATKELGVPANRIVLYGESLGGGVAIRLASDLCNEGIEPGGLIAESTFNSLVAAGGYHFPFLPVKLMLFDRFNSEMHIRKVTCPVLQIHGQQDHIVPFSLGEKLFAAVPEKSSTGVPKTFVRLPRADHNDVYGVDVKQVAEALTQFLKTIRQKNQ